MFQNRCFHHQIQILKTLVNGNIFDQDDFNDDRVVQILENKILRDGYKSAAYLAVQISEYVKYSYRSIDIEKILEIFDLSSPERIIGQK